MIDDEWKHWYRTLGLTPGIQDWALVKKRYHELIRSLHPDRFSPTDPQRQIAEEHSKLVISAYRQLSRYYRRVGALPTVDEFAHVLDTPTSSSRVAPVSPPKPKPSGASKAKSPSRQRFVAVLALSALLIGTYVGWRHYQTARAESDMPLEALPLVEKRDTSDIEAFTFGASPGAVYAAQGVPTRIDGNTWYYGLSEVHFDSGHVVSWNENPNNPLNVSLQNPDDDGE